MIVFKYLSVYLVRGELTYGFPGRKGDKEIHMPCPAVGAYEKPLWVKQKGLKTTGKQKSDG